MSPFADIPLVARPGPHGPPPAGCFTHDFWEHLDHFMGEALAEPGGFTAQRFAEIYDEFMERELREQMDESAWRELLAEAAHQQQRAILLAMVRYTSAGDEDKIDGA